MDKPAILAVDDEPGVLSALTRDLRREYGEQYRIVRADSGTQALEVLEQLKLRGDPVALLVSDQRMPGMEGVDFLARAVELFPDARRVLLTAYADTDAAIKAINQVKLDNYLMKPWDPPEQRLYPVLADLLDDWQASFRPPFEGVTLVGYRWSADSHRAKDFLARNLIPYRWLDVEVSEEAANLVELANLAADRLPLVRFGDGTHLVQPSNLEIAEKVGLRVRAEHELYDLVITGAGPAGLAAAVYGASEGLRTVLIESKAPGGQAGSSSFIENYLGFPKGISGDELARRAVSQATRFGAEILTPVNATGVRLQDPYRFVVLSDGSEIGCKALLITTGVSYRLLDVPGADRLAGAGVYYGAAGSEAPLCTSQEVFIVGAGNSAGQAAMHLSRYAASVTLLVRGDSLERSMSHYLIAQLRATPNISTRLCTYVEEVHGESHVEAVTLVDAEGRREKLPAYALFVFIGVQPYTDWVADVVQRDRHGFILSGQELVHDGKPPKGWTLDRDPFWLETSVPGIFVAGDVRSSSIKRAASAVGEGSMAVQFIHQHLATL